MTPEQCQAARRLLGWTPQDIARAAGVSVITVRNFEEGKPGPRRSAVAAMTCAFEGAGVIFEAPGGKDNLGVTISATRQGGGQTP